MVSIGSKKKLFFLDLTSINIMVFLSRMIKSISPNLERKFRLTKVRFCFCKYCNARSSPVLPTLVRELFVVILVK